MVIPELISKEPSPSLNVLTEKWGIIHVDDYLLRNGINKKNLYALRIIGLNPNGKTFMTDGGTVRLDEISRIICPHKINN